MLNNEFHEFDVQKLAVKIRIEEARRTGDVLSVTPSLRQVAPGDKLELQVLVRPFQQQPEVLSIPIRIPDTVAEGNVLVSVLDYSNRRLSEQQERPNRLKPEDLTQFIEWLARPEDRRKLYVRLTPSGGGVAIQGVELPSLPMSVLAAIRHPVLSGPTPIREVIETEFMTPWVIESRHRFPLAIKR
ncbi:MAG: hypothetical protein HYU36_01880 [Planctomycetes bacterium]|nr:hypothetical protein [Planctomycetota bacterium]